MHGGRTKSENIHPEIKLSLKLSGHIIPVWMRPRVAVKCNSHRTVLAVHFPTAAKNQAASSGLFTGHNESEQTAPTFMIDFQGV
jgi:hypothetical protein